MQTVTRKFVQATFVHIDDISAVSDPILPNLFDKIFFGPKFRLTKHFFDQNIFLTKIIFVLNLVDRIYFETKTF